jgi:hypothetical protein
MGVLQDTLERAKRVCGPEDMETLGCYQSLATELGNQDREDEALVVYQKRVLGPDHPSVLLAAMNHALTAARSGQLVEAEAMYAENLAKQTRVLGADHPETQRASSMLARLRRVIESQSASQIELIAPSC